MSEANEFGVDPWAWLHEIGEEETPDLSEFHVVVGMYAAQGSPARCRAAIDAQTAPISDIVTELTSTTPGDWFWIVPDDCEPEPDALAALLTRVLHQPDAAVVGALLIEPRRRGAGKLVSDWAQTISSNGRMRTLTDPGELYQGQLTAGPALGVPMAGMLVRGDVWRFLGGFNPMMPEGHRGLDFGWRANLTGYLVVVEPEAQLTNYADFDDPVQARAAGLALVLAHTKARWRWLMSVRLTLVTALMSLGFLLGKDLDRASEEIRGLWEWIRGTELRRSLNDQLASLPVNTERAAGTRSLRPTLSTAIRRAAGLTMARIGGWLETFSGGAASVSIEEMIGDDFAEQGNSSTKIPFTAVAVTALAIGALVAARGAFGSGYLTGSQLLPAPSDWVALVNSYLAPVPGSAAAGAPWVGLVGLFSFFTLGRPDWLVTGLEVLVVPLAWLVTFRLLRQVVKDRYLAGAAALVYALTPAMIGGLNTGSLGLVVCSVILPVLAYGVWNWMRGRDWSWRLAGAVAFWTTLLVSLVPLFWVAALAGAVYVGWQQRARRVWLQWGAILIAPLFMLIGPWGLAVVRYPGRLLTGVEPILAPTQGVPAWQLLVGHPLESGAPLWLAIGFFGVCWIAAFVGAWRRPTYALPALAVAGGITVVLILITRFVVMVPPGVAVRPQGLEWQLLLVAALLAAIVTGLDGITGELSGAAVGLRHLGLLGLVLVAGASLVISAGWWVLEGQDQLSRTSAVKVPAFVQKVQLTDRPGRTLAIGVVGGLVRWSLIEGDGSRLGGTERGLAFGGDRAAYALAGSVVNRLVGNSADEQIVPDLQHLGVSFVTLTGGEDRQRVAINNTPALGHGIGTDKQYVWPVPGSGIAVAVDGTVRTVVGNDVDVPAGSQGRQLYLAQPADPRWEVSVNRVSADPQAGNPPGTQFGLSTDAGVMRITLAPGSQWWVWLQFAVLTILAVLAAPALRRRAVSEPRRIAGGDES